MNTACPSYIAPSFDVDTGSASRENRGDVADEFSFYKMVWIFIIGSVAGFAVETLWCRIRCGHFESRTSLIFVPFTVIYGIGAAVMYVMLYRLKRDQKFNIFFIGALAGTGIEFVGSYAQEMMFGSVSWDYSDAPFNVGGRVCLTYSLYWGALALAWVFWIQPFIEKKIERVPDSVGVPLTYAVVIFLAVAAVLTIITVIRWSDRAGGLQSVTALGTWIDAKFPNALMEAVYPNMKFLTR